MHDTFRDAASQTAHLKWYQAWAIRSPLAQIDRHLLFLRWGVILSIGATTFFTGFEGDEFVSPVPVFAALFAFNGVLSLVLWNRRPIERGYGGRLLLLDTVQSFLSVALTGGYRSAFFLFFLLPIGEVAFAFQWRAALAAVLALDVLQLLASVFNTAQNWQAFAAYIVATKFILLLIVGALVSLFGDLSLRESRARAEAIRSAAQIKVLNDFFYQLGESHLDLDRTLHIILEKTLLLPSVAYAFVLFPDKEPGGWRVSASTSESHPVGETVQVPETWETAKTLLLTKPGQEHFQSAPLASVGVNHLVSVRLVSPDGETEGFLVAAQKVDLPLNDGEQRFLRSLAREASLALRNAKFYAQEKEQLDQLRRFEKLRGTFFSAIGHELKTPLTVIKTLAPSMYQFDKLPRETQLEVTRTIEHNLDRLERLIGDLLDSARLEAGAVRLHPRSLNLTPRLEKVLADLDPLLKGKRISVEIRAPDSPPPVWAEARHLDHILSNLIHNAVKFSPFGETITIEVAHQGDRARVCVGDRGPGVPGEKRQRIFDKFFVGVEQDALAGVGLGLYICRELVRLHGGEIWVEPNPGGGSRFCFTLPLAP